MRIQCLSMGLFTAFSAQAAAPEPTQTSPLYVGVVEIVRLGDGHDLRIRAPFNQLRYVFKNEGGTWTHIPDTTRESPPRALARTVWHVADQGKIVGTVRTDGTPGPESGPHAFALPLEPPFPEVQEAPGNIKYIFYGWSTDRRPLLAVTRSDAAADPEDWVRARLSNGELNRVISEMRSRHPKLPVCAEEGVGGGPVAYKDDDIAILSAFRDRQNRLVVGFQFNAQARDVSGCESYITPELDDHWVLMHPNGKVSDLGTRMSPLWPADLDSDGKSEWVFKLEPHHVDGYRLFHNGFSETVDAFWVPE